MDNKKQKQTHPEVGEDATQYGEFVSSYFAWVPLPEQKQKAEEMANITKGKNAKREPAPNCEKREPAPNCDFQEENNDI